VEEALSYDDAQGIIRGIFDANWKLDAILRYLSGEDDEEEEDGSDTS
jgi:hypothetical protein